jgi:hypothetical protein
LRKFKNFHSKFKFILNPSAPATKNWKNSFLFISSIQPTPQTKPSYFPFYFHQQASAHLPFLAHQAQSATFLLRWSIDKPPLPPFSGARGK